MSVKLQYDRDELKELFGNWIWAPIDKRTDKVINCAFRRKFKTGELGADAILRISADSRYRVWVNGEFVGRGPCRGSLAHYNFETYKIGHLLNEGDDSENVLGVDVRWYGNHAPVAEIHAQAGLWAMLGNSEKPDIIHTDTEWLCQVSDAFTTDPIPTSYGCKSYCVVDPCEDVDLRKIPFNWDRVGYDDASWSPAVRVYHVEHRDQSVGSTVVFHELEARRIPMLEEKPILPEKIMQVGRMEPQIPPHMARYIQGPLTPADQVPEGVFWGDDATELHFEQPGTDYVIVSMGVHTTAYPIIHVNTHVDAMVEMRYCESLSNNGKKKVRDNIDDGTVEGYFDVFTCRKGDNAFEPYAWRSFRFVRITIHHPNGPATIKKFDPVFTGYPFEQKGTFESSEPLHSQLWDISWRTARLCAHEHYEDCPYYEQIQYISDTRLQALISYIVAGDFRLARQALEQFAQDKRSDGITKSRQPTSMFEMQVIPQFSLFWIMFLEDFYIHSADESFIKQLWHCVESVLQWFEQFTEEDDLIYDTPYWNFTDWSMNPGSHHCGSIGELNVRRVGALQAAARMAEVIGLADRSEFFDNRQQKISAAIKAKLRNSDGIYMDSVDGMLIGEHTSIAAICYDLVTGDEARELIEKLEARDDLARTTIYHSYYTFRAYEKLGLFERAWQTRMDNWTDQLKLNATTWFESPEPRSDCHAWGSWIMCDMLNCILGIRPASAGFNTVTIKPHLLDLEHASGSVVTIHGNITGRWERTADKASFEYCLPEGVSGEFIAPDGSKHALDSGINKIECSLS